MKKISRCIITLILLIVVFCQILPLNCDAVEINYHNVAVGDIVTYELHAGSCPKDIRAVDVSIYYDSGALEIVEDTLELPNLSGYVINTDLEGEIRFNAINLDGFQFQADKILATLQFRVISDYNPYPYLKYEIRNFIDIEFADHLETYTYDLTYINKESSSEAENESDSDIVSAVSDTLSDSEALTESDSDISSLSDSDTSDTDTVLETSSSDTVVSSESNSMNASEKFVVSSEKEYNTPDIPETNDSLSNNNSNVNLNFIFGIAVVFVILLAIIFIIIKKSSNKGSHMSE